jgi:acetate kinase
MRLVVVNAGSSSVKLRVVDGDEVLSSADLGPPDQGLTDEVDGFLESAGAIDGSGHRVVHGGGVLTRPVVVDDDVRAELGRLEDLAPLHNPPATRAIDAFRRLRPDLPAVACFDTAFHAALPAAASTYALPGEWVRRWGVRRFGFHGLSCQWATRRAGELTGRPVDSLRLIVCHLGGGASVTAIVGGRSVDTTMGFTPTEGLVMATRSGDVDPAAVVWLIRHGVDPAEMESALERRSGVLALSGGVTGDMRDLLAARDAGDAAARLAVDVYVHRLRAKIAAMAAAAGGLDVLVFTGGVGEHGTSIRAAAADGLRWMGVQLDPAANASAGADADISAPGAPVTTLVVTSREELVIAAGCREALATA